MPGSYAICPVCFWEDDAIQFRWPTMNGGANKVCLIEAQRNHQDFGACDQHGRRFARPPAADQPLAPTWRPIDVTRDFFEVWGVEDWAPVAVGPLHALLVAAHLLAPQPAGVMTSGFKRLVQQLNGEAGESYDARAELIGIGSDAIPTIVDGLPYLSGFGQLTAIEVFEEVGDPRCGPALIGLLKSDNPTVREWAAMALASLDIDGAVEPLRRAYRACLQRATPPDWTEPRGIPLGPDETRRPHPCSPTAHRMCTSHRCG
ncbi:CPCC family cysteine-rich protein [Streptomyces griseoviridis]|uniref:Cysteine-rich CPCC domain-containing protein n=1 Tax=Streptomyces griseoviridis TaxID=45398 RepID=A0A918LAF3_STRGD|nr:CPCC family cysteine-rich protein [Streptomyces niveoruber]GGS26116.1 hypothetical protein GCM10010238_13090 [Streptomyces niveoruber]